VIHYPNLIILGIEASGFTVVATIGLLHLIFQGEKQLMQLKNMSIARKLSVILAAAAVILVIGHELELYLPDLELWIENLGAFCAAGLYRVICSSDTRFVSVDTLCFAAGLLFSLGAAELYIIIATYLSSALIFFLGRYLIKDRVVTFIAKHKQLAALDTTNY